AQQEIRLFVDHVGEWRWNVRVIVVLGIDVGGGIDRQREWHEQQEQGEKRGRESFCESLHAGAPSVSTPLWLAPRAEWVEGQVARPALVGWCCREFTDESSGKAPSSVPQAFVWPVGAADSLR